MPRRFGEAHPAARYDNDTVARVKAMLRDAKTVTILAPGELRRIAEETGVTYGNVRSIHNGQARTDVVPAE